MNSTRPYRELLLKSLSNPEDARLYLQAVLEDYPEGFPKAVRNVLEASQNEAGARALPSDFHLRELTEVLADLGLKLSIKLISEQNSPVIVAETKERQLAHS